MKQTKNIKVYGTLVNNTLDTSVADTDHNDVLMNAYQLYDGRFGDTPAPKNFQDIINKRLTAIQYADGTTTIKNRDGVTPDDYVLEVYGDTNIKGDLNIEGDNNIGGDLHVGGNISGISLNDLDDVTLGTLSAGKILKYDGTKWIAGTDDSGSTGSTTLADLTDTNIPNPISGHILVYDGDTQKWMGVSINQLINGIIINGAQKLSDLSDVDPSISTATQGQVLVYNQVTEKWEPKTLSSGSGGFQQQTYTITLRKKASYPYSYNSTVHSQNAQDITGQLIPGKNNAYLYVSDETVLFDSANNEQIRAITSSTIFSDISKQRVFSSNVQRHEYSGSNWNVYINGTQKQFYTTTRWLTPSELNSHTGTLANGIDDTDPQSILTVATHLPSAKYYYGNSEIYDTNNPSVSTADSFATTDPNDNIVKNYVYISNGPSSITYPGLTTNWYTTYINDSGDEIMNSVTEAQYLTARRWRTGTIPVEAPANSFIWKPIVASDIVMPDTITLTITTRKEVLA